MASWPTNSHLWPSDHHLLSTTPLTRFSTQKDTPGKSTKCRFTIMHSNMLPLNCQAPIPAVHYSQYGNPVSRHGALSCAKSRYCQLVGSPGGSKVGSMASLALFCSARQHYCRAGSNCATRFSAKPCHGKPLSGQYLTINWPAASRKGLRSMGLSTLRIAGYFANRVVETVGMWYTGPQLYA